jgi:glycosyltransferase involved in cell wall biosynthesis
VLVVVDSLFGGGAEAHAVDLARGLQDLGWQVELACSAIGCSAEKLHRIGVPCHELAGRVVKRRFSLRYTRRLRRLLTTHHYDVVHAHVFASEVAARLALHGLAVPLVVTEHTEAPWRGALAKSLSRLVYRRAAVVIAVSQAITRLLMEEYGVPAHKLTVILPVGRRSLRPPSRGARIAGLPPGPLVGFVGRLQPEKGVDVLLDAFRLVRSLVADASLVIVGQGHERAALQAKAAELGIAGCVHFVGHRDDVPALLASLDVLAVPSRSDGSPLVLHEALQAGVAVVGSRVGGIPDRLGDGQAGILVAPESPEHLATAISSLLLDPQARAALAERGKQHAALHSYRAMVATVSDLYRSLTGAASPSVG